jgi:hypothetical protein
MPLEDQHRYQFTYCRVAPAVHHESFYIHDIHCPIIARVEARGAVIETLPSYPLQYSPRDLALALQDFNSPLILCSICLLRDRAGSRKCATNYSPWKISTRYSTNSS